ncbi:MAG: ester cyclase [Bacteroidota bacterium]
MKRLFTLILLVLSYNTFFGQMPDSAMLAKLEANKALARAFYEDLWFNNRTENYHKYVAETYVAHDIGDRKNITEPAKEQKEIADFFWANGAFEGKIDYQVAEGDLVATRWTGNFIPSTLLGRFGIGGGEIPIINVFRIHDGKIVELWNHRHDIDTNQTLPFVLRGFFMGLLISLIPLYFVRKYRRQLKQVG